MNNRICLVEDEEDLSQILRMYLEKANYEVTVCATVLEAREFQEQEFFAWVIDIMLPDGNGLELLRELKAESPQTRVIIISAKGDRFDRVAGFEIGCDDYIAKPFLPAELVYRVDKLGGGQQRKDSAAVLPNTSYTIDYAKRMIYFENQRLEITSREFDIILYFLQNKGEAISRGQMLEGIWGADYLGNDRIVDNYVKNIRKKLPQLPLETIYGYGYRYNV